MKVCSKCKVPKSLDKFYVIKGIQNHGCLRSECKECGKKYGKRKPEPAAEPERNNHYNPFEWRTFVQPCLGQNYDPYTASNRYGGARHG